MRSSYQINPKFSDKTRTNKKTQDEKAKLKGSISGYPLFSTQPKSRSRANYKSHLSDVIMASCTDWRISEWYATAIRTNSHQTKSSAIFSSNVPAAPCLGYATSGKLSFNVWKEKRGTVGQVSCSLVGDAIRNVR